MCPPNKANPPGFFCFVLFFFAAFTLRFEIREHDPGMWVLHVAHAPSLTILERAVNGRKSLEKQFVRGENIHIRAES